MKLYKISHQKFAKYLHVKILRNIIRNFTKYHTKLYKISPIEIYTSKFYETLQTLHWKFAKCYALKPYEISHRKFCEVLHVKFYESTRIITKYYVYVILRWPRKLTKFFRAKFYANFCAKKFSDVVSGYSTGVSEWIIFLTVIFFVIYISAAFSVSSMSDKLG